MRKTKKIKYTKGYKYMLEEVTYFYSGIFLEKAYITRWVVHCRNGMVRIEKGFGWDGCSALAWDTKSNMRAGLFHDAMYYLFRHGFPQKYRPIADMILKTTMIEDGAWHCRANLFKWAVENFAASSADPENARKILTAP